MVLLTVREDTAWVVFTGDDALDERRKLLCRQNGAGWGCISCRGVSVTRGMQSKDRKRASFLAMIGVCACSCARGNRKLCVAFKSCEQMH